MPELQAMPRLQNWTNLVEVEPLRRPPENVLQHTPDKARQFEVDPN